MAWYHILEIFSCVCSDISNLAHRHSSKLAKIIRPIAILLSGEFQENHILGSTDICLGTTPNHIFGDIFLRLYFVVISQIWHIEILLNSPDYPSYLTIRRFKKIVY